MTNALLRLLQIMKIFKEKSKNCNVLKQVLKSLNYDAEMT